MPKIQTWWSFSASIAVFCALLACRKLALEAKVTGYKPDSNTVVIVHVKTARNSSVTCAPGGLTCSSQSVNYEGEADLEIDLEGVNASVKEKVAHLEAQTGPRKANLTVNLGASGLPPKLDIGSAGAVKCVGRKCEGELDLPKAHLKLDTEPGTVVEVGKEKLTADAAGKIDSAVAIVTEPPLKELPLATLCGLEAKPLGKATVTVTFADGVKVTGDVALDSKTLGAPVRASLMTIAQGKVLFPWENGKDAPKRGRAALFVGESSCSSGGPSGATLGDVGVVVTAEYSSRDDLCIYKLSEKSSGTDKGVATGKLTLYDAKATAYQRVTGAKLGTKTFKAEKKCNESLDLSNVNEKIADQTSYASGYAIVTWGASLAR